MKHVPFCRMFPLLELRLKVQPLLQEPGLKGTFVVQDMASSSGRYQISRRHAMAFLGFWGVPFLLWLMVLLISYITFMATCHLPCSFSEDGSVRCVRAKFLAKAVFWARYVRPFQACCFHIACGCVTAFTFHWIRLVSGLGRN